MIRSILVVCTGNLCRSPMAEGFLKRMLPRVEVLSAGVDALDGYSADPTAAELMLQQGVDISKHRSRRVNGIIVTAADLILAMDISQKQYVERRFVEARGKVFRVCESYGTNVEDPYLLGRQHYGRAVELILKGTTAWASKIGSLGPVGQNDSLAP
jgi:protein-tyrosine phosphatase